MAQLDDGPRARAGRSAQTPGNLQAAVSPPFGLKFSNIPLINLRMEYERARAFLNSSEAEECLKPPVKPIRAGLFIWGGMPGDFMTLVLQRAILGIEAYLPGALMHTSARLGRLSGDLVAKLKNPFSFGAKSAVAIGCRPLWTPSSVFGILTKTCTN